MGSIETLTTDTCLGLLGTSTIGRLGLMINGYPHIFPVNYVLDGSLVTFRTGPGTKFDESQHGTVCFQVDQTEAAQPVLEVASRDVVSVSPDDSAMVALNVMIDEQIEHVPVLDDDELVGICTREDQREPFRELVQLAKSAVA